MSFMLVVGLSLGLPAASVQLARAYDNQQVLYPERGYWRIIDKTGKFVFEKRFERCPDIQERDMLAAEYSPSNRYESDLHYFSYDFAGNRLRALASGPESPCWEDGTCAEGLTSFKEDGLFGYFDQTGKKVIPARFRCVGQFKEGYALVSLANGAPGSVPDTFAIIDRTGQIVWTSKGFTQKLNDVNMAVVQVGSRYFAVQKLSVRKDIQFVDWFKGDELYCSQDLERMVSRTIPSFNDSPRKSGIALRKDGTYREANQEEVVDCYSEGLGAVKRDGRWQYVDSAGATKIMLPEKASTAYPFSEGLAVVGMDCNPNPPTDLVLQHGGLGAAASSPGPFLYGVIDKSGAFVIPPRYSKIGTAFADGLLMVGQGDDTLAQCGYINKSGELVIALVFQGAENFRNGIAAVFLNDPALTKQNADEQRKKEYIETCKKLIGEATKKFFSVANLRVSVLPGEKLTVQLEKWAGPGKLREGLLTALKAIDLPPLPAVLVDQSNLEFSASRAHGVVVSQSPDDPFNAVRARLIEVQTELRDKGSENLTTEMLEKQWRCSVAWYEWENYLDRLFRSLSERYEKEHQAEKLKALNALAADLRPKAEKTQRQLIFTLLWEGNKLYLQGKFKDAGTKYQKAASFFDPKIITLPEEDWPPVSLTALYTYACFLATQKQFKASNVVFERVLAEATNRRDTWQMPISQDYLDTYLELIRQVQPELYQRYRAGVKEAKLASVHSTGFIDKQGNTVIAPEFKTAKEFKGGLAAVETVKGWGYIDKSGAWKIAPTYETVDSFGDGLAPVSGKHQFFPLERLENAAPQFRYIDSNAKVIIDKPFSYALPFVDGIACVQSPGEVGRYCIDRLGKSVCETNRLIEPIGDLILESHALPKTGELQDSYFTRNLLLGPDKDGQYKIVADDLNPFFVESADKTILFGYKDSAGKVVIEPKYLRAHFFTDDLAGVEIAPGKYAFVDKAGLVKIPGPFSSVRWFHNGHAWVEKDSKWFLIDTKGEIKSEKFARLDELPDFFSVLAINGEKKFLFSDQVQGLDVSDYSIVRLFHEGLAAVQKDNKWGFIDTSGKLVVPTKYPLVGDFSEGLASAYFP
jgi:tetratricopeptide (TPR) repeat protein